MKLASENTNATPQTWEQKAARRRGLVFGAWVDRVLRDAEEAERTPPLTSPSETGAA